MNSKHLNFLTFCWFISMLICVILEGSYFGSSERSLINNLTIYTPFSVGSFSIPVFNTGFFTTIWKALTWDYSFYTGGYQLIRYFWMAVLSPGMVWGMVVALQYMWTTIISLLKIV